MKHSLLTLLFLCIIAFSANAQNVGGGLAIGTEDNIGVGLGAIAQFPTANKDLVIAPSFILFFPDDPLNFWELNADVNYYFSRSSASVYGILGLNIARVGVDVPTGEGGGSDTEVGLNLGVGVDLDIDSSVTPFAQMKYSLSDFDQLVIFAGVRFPF